jgi:flavin-dependent dehydrogenase
MSLTQPIAIIGGGPAGALAGSLLADGGRDIFLFDEKLAWEKPCGGGITHKALQQYPFLAEAKTECNLIEHCELFSPSGKSVSFRLQQPVAIFSRLALNSLMLERARHAGVAVHNERVTNLEKIGDGWKLRTPDREYSAAFVILAAGARNPFRSQFVESMSPSDLMVTAGYFIPGRSSLMQLQFLKDITGYIWIFPRADHLSAGIAGKMGELPTIELRRELEKWLHAHGYNLDGAKFYSHILPSFRQQTFASLQVSGDGWAMIGDSAGLVDPITGEGLYYALRSAELCAESILDGQTTKYGASLREEILPELTLAARISQRFYNGEIFGESVLEKMISLTGSSAAFRELMSDLFAGVQGYRTLRSRLYSILPTMAAEGLASALRSPWSDAKQRAGKQSTTTTGPLADDPLAE